MISSPTAVFAWLAFLVALTFWASSLPAMQRWFRAIPPIIHCYFLPTISTALGITPLSSPAYDWMTRFLLPIALFLLMVSVDVPAILSVGPKALLMMLAGTVGIIIGAPIAFLTFSHWLPPEACSYRMAVVSIRKRYAGQARRLMFGLWSALPQFTLTKMIVVVDPDIDVRSWEDVIWAISTRADPVRDLVTITDTPIDYLDFASPKPGLGGKLGIDATNKIGPETQREWGRPIAMDDATRARVDAIWQQLGL